MIFIKRLPVIFAMLLSICFVFPRTQQAVRPNPFSSVNAGAQAITVTMVIQIMTTGPAISAKE